MNQQFNFHDIVALQLETDDAGAAEFYAAELGAHSGEVTDGLPRVEVRWRHAWLPRSPGPEYQRQVHKRLAHWYYTIEFSGGRVRIDCVGNRLAVPMAWHMLIHPSLSYLAAQVNWVMLHAAAVVREGRSLILTGRGGVGKTTTSSLLLRSGPEWMMHADDYVFVGFGSESRAFATRSHAYLDLLRWLPDLRYKLSAVELLRLLFFGSLRVLSGNRIRWPLRLEARRLWPNRALASSAHLGAILLVGDRTQDAVQLRRLEVGDDPAAELLAVNLSERRHFERLLRSFMGEGEADRILGQWRQREHGLLDKVVRENAVYELGIPRRATSDPGLVQQISSELHDLLLVRSAGGDAS